MMQWARRDLEDAAASPGVQWLVALFHHPPFTKGSHDSDREIELVEMRQNYLPMLVRGRFQACSADTVVRCC
jgi:hypothetical protein